jgi:hypothetical protein
MSASSPRPARARIVAAKRDKPLCGARNLKLHCVCAGKTEIVYKVPRCRSGTNSRFSGARRHANSPHDFMAGLAQG